MTIVGVSSSCLPGVKAVEACDEVQSQTGALNEGSPREILRAVYPEPFDFAQDKLRRRAQNDMAKKLHYKVYPSHDF